MSQEYANAIHFVEAMPVTNAACCNDSHVQCPKCAAAAMIVKHGPPGSSVQTINMEEAPLPIPSYFGAQGGTTHPFLDDGPVLNTLNDSDIWNRMFAEDVMRRTGNTKKPVPPQPHVNQQLTLNDDSPLPPLTASDYGFPG